MSGYVPKNKVMSIGPGFMVGQWVVELINMAANPYVLSSTGEDAMVWIVMSLLAYWVPDSDESHDTLRTPN